MKKLSLYFLTFLCLIFATKLCPMNAFKNRFKLCSWKTAAFGAFAGTCTAVHYGLSYVPAMAHIVGTAIFATNLFTEKCTASTASSKG